MEQRIILEYNLKTSFNNRCSAYEGKDDKKIITEGWFKTLFKANRRNPKF